MSSNHCLKNRSPLAAHMHGGRRLRNGRQVQISSERMQQWRAVEDMGLSVLDAVGLAEFLVRQQSLLSLPAISTPDAALPAQGAQIVADTAPVTVDAFPSQKAHADKLLLGFHNLGHFLDWLDAQAAKREAAQA